MPIEQKLIRCERPDDPRRCQANIRNAQCPWVAMEGSKYCSAHCGPVAKKAENEQKLRTYRLNKWQSRVSELADDDKIKSLREEIGILRMTLEEVLNLCHEPNKILMYSNQISDLVIKIEKLVTSTHRLETSTGLLLDKASALKLANDIVQIISSHISDEDVIDKVSNDIITSIVGAKKDE